MIDTEDSISFRESTSSFNDTKQLYRWVILEKLYNPFGFTILGLLSVLVSWIVLSGGLEAGVAILVCALGIPVGLICLFNTKLGFIITLVASSFIFILPRITGLYDLPVGSLPDILLLLTFCGLFINRENRFTEVTAYRSPIFYIIIIWICYLFSQGINPNSISVSAWLLSVRGIISYTLTYFVLIRLFDCFRDVKLFTICWLFIALLAAAYAGYQEFVGLPGYDLAWVQRSPKSIGLNFIRGRWRKWSFLSDPATFGMFMSFAGVFSTVMAVETEKAKHKVIFIGLSLVFITVMTYSGTRTAVAMTVAGIALYGVLTIHRKNTLVLGAFTAAVILVILYVPYYGSATINSVRSTFSPSDDASFNVRVANKERIQPYLRSHPIGGGINTTGALGESLAPGHPLAGFPPDSYYMNIALETGWIGLVICTLLFFVVLAVGIINYARCNDPKIKAMYAAYIASFFALTVAGYAQESINQLPMRFVFYGCFALMDRLQYFDRTLYPGENLPTLSR